MFSFWNNSRKPSWKFVFFQIELKCYFSYFTNLSDFLKKRLKEYDLFTPISTDSGGHFLSHLLSANHKHRIKRNVPSSSEQTDNRLYFNVTAFGKEFHLRLWPNSRLVAPGATVEWHEETSEPGNNTENTTHTVSILKREQLKSDCSFIGDITDVPGASVAINNCDGLVSFLFSILIFKMTV